MNKKERYKAVLDYFQKVSPPTVTELNYVTPFELLVAVVLSAQCTDKRINQITPALFAAFPTPEVMAAASPEVIFEYIKSVSYPNSKAKHLAGLAQMLVKEFGGEVPERFEDLTRLPGVGRKTANVISAIVFGRAALAVDTHVYRVSRRIGLVARTDNTPYKVEVALKRHIADELVVNAHFWLLHHGRYTCTARTPHCDDCGLRLLCRYYIQKHKASPVKTS